jgi:hypothetical protein
VTTEDFIRVAESFAKKDLDAFLETWLYTPEKPAGLAAADATRVQGASRALRESSPLTGRTLKK